MNADREYRSPAASEVRGENSGKNTAGSAELGERLIDSAECVCYARRCCEDLMRVYLIEKKESSR